MAKAKKEEVPTLVREWPLPASATLGSSVRAHGILLEMRAHLPWALKKSVKVAGPSLVLGMVDGQEEEFRAVSEIIDRKMVDIEALPVIPREIEDILGIKTSERHRWVKDGRIRSAGTRTVKLRGRAKEITFHVFDPKHVVELLDDDMMSIWREDDAEAAIEKRRRAAETRRLVRLQKLERAPARDGHEDAESTGLVGWDEFMRDGMLR